MTNLFPLPYWAPALQRVPTPFRALNEAFTFGDRSLEGACPHLSDADQRPGFDHVSTARRKTRNLWSLWSSQFGV
ncbi:MAG: hypothetical protein JJE37_10565 [Methyloceanibacter sp.]|nr:hypothetical protein [Methyloceanibacter sp.]